MHHPVALFESTANSNKLRKATPQKELNGTNLDVGFYGNLMTITNVNVIYWDPHTKGWTGLYLVTETYERGTSNVSYFHAHLYCWENICVGENSWTKITRLFSHIDLMLTNIQVYRHADLLRSERRAVLKIALIPSNDFQMLPQMDVKA